MMMIMKMTMGLLWGAQPVGGGGDWGFRGFSGRDARISQAKASTPAS